MFSGRYRASLAEKQDNYLEAITYELSFLKEFILNQASDDDDVFVLMGDRRAWLYRQAQRWIWHAAAHHQQG